MKKTFEQWKREVDEELYDLCGLDSDGLPDWQYKTAYEEKMSPKRAARAVLRNAREM